MSELVVVANRGPATIHVAPDGELAVAHGAGGLAPSLARAVAGTPSTFVAAAMSEGEHRAAREGLPKEMTDVDLSFVEAPEEVRQGAYSVVANQTLWFLYHGLFELPRRPLFDHRFSEAFDSYREFNRLFAEAVAARADEGATVVVHDYHLSLVGATLARIRPDLRTVHFTHTPFCTPEELRVMPDAIADELISGLASFGACGFHTERWRERFARCVQAGGRSVPSFAAPLGTDAKELETVLASEAVRERLAKLEDVLDDRQLLLRSDRVELSKNVLRGFLAYEELLAEQPRRRGSVTFVARLYASRTDLAEYLAYRSEIELLAARVNERFGTASWQPIVLEVADDFPASVAALSRYDVLLVNPIRDGMNLVAKEGPVLNRRGGALVLSREAGAYEELGQDSVGVNPFDVRSTAAALATALDLAPDERAARAERLATVAAGQPPGVWHQQVIDQARLVAR